jgi:hypothetical protein
MLTPIEAVVLEMLNNGAMLWQVEELVPDGTMLDGIVEDLKGMGFL